MNYDLLFLIGFYLILLIIFKIYRSKFEVQGKIFFLYKTKLGIKLMDKLAKKFPKTLSIIGTISIIVGFVGMIITLAIIIFGTYILLTKPGAPPQLAPVLPGIHIEGLPALSFWHWIISILIVATVHEFMHGVYARLGKIKIKSSGFAFLGPILAAFVEPDEKQLAKSKTKTQLKILSAGPFANIILAVFILIILLVVVNPINSQLVEVKGVRLAELNESYPIINSGIKSGDVLIEINGMKINDVEIVSNIISKTKPGDLVNIKTENKNYEVKLGNNPSNSSVASLGVNVESYKLGAKESINKNFLWIVPIMGWIGLLVFWLFNISLGVGLFNLLPIGPVDGGKMFYTATKHFTNKKAALVLLNIVSALIILLIIINLWPFIFKLLKYIFSPIILLF